MQARWTVRNIKARQSRRPHLRVVKHDRDCAYSCERSHWLFFELFLEVPERLDIRPGKSVLDIGRSPLSYRLAGRSQEMGAFGFPLEQMLRDYPDLNADQPVARPSGHVAFDLDDCGKSAKHRSEGRGLRAEPLRQDRRASDDWAGTGSGGAQRAVAIGSPSALPDTQRCRSPQGAEVPGRLQSLRAQPHRSDQCRLTPRTGVQGTHGDRHDRAPSILSAYHVAYYYCDGTLFRCIAARPSDLNSYISPATVQCLRIICQRRTS